MSSGRPRVVLLTGAGISADSGVATFRDSGGSWEGVRPEDVATPEAWARDRAMVWRFYQARRAQLREVAPNPAHTALVEFTTQIEGANGSCTLITQNVDDLHERAGSRDLLHMHGEITLLRCEACGHRVRNVDHTDPDEFVPCAACDHDALRPDVVWFGEMPYHQDAIEDAMRTCTHFVAIGTSGNVWPAAGLLHAARAAGASTWVQSLDAPENLHPDDKFFGGRAKDTARALFDALLASAGTD